MKTLLTATALILSMTAAANAAEPARSFVLAGGPIYSLAQNTLLCKYINFGSINIIPTAQEIFSADSTTALTSSYSSCANGTPIVPNQTCFTIIEGGLPAHFLSCKVSFSTAATNVRGALELYDNNSNLVDTVELR